MPQKLRPDIDDYFLKMAKVVAERSTCIRRKIGAVAVRDKYILSTGYNGAASGIKDCTLRGCLRDQNNIKSGKEHQICRAVHAEQNIIIQAALNGTIIKGATVYCTDTPCIICAKMLVNAKIKEFVCFNNYPDKHSEKLFKEAGIVLRVIAEPRFDFNMIKERVLAVDVDVFKKAGSFTGFKSNQIDEFYVKIRNKVKFVDRDEAEADESLKQIIPYILVHHKNTYLVLQRITTSEKRLHNAYTFGVGGHINPIDSGGADEKDIIERGMFREMYEEIDIKNLKSIKLVGFIYDNSQDVSRHHLGFVYDAEIGDKNVEIIEKNNFKPYFVKVKDMPKYLNGKESWAEIVYKHYIVNK